MIQPSREKSLDVEKARAIEYIQHGTPVLPLDRKVRHGE
jgi:hypothetical protein